MTDRTKENPKDGSTITVLPNKKSTELPKCAKCKKILLTCACSDNSLNK